MNDRRRTILTVLSIGISVFMFGALMTLPSVVAHILRDRVSTLRLVCANKAGFAYQLPAAYGSTIRLRSFREVKFFTNRRFPDDQKQGAARTEFARIRQIKSG